MRSVGRAGRLERVEALRVSSLSILPTPLLVTVDGTAGGTIGIAGTASKTFDDVV